ncbi:protein RUFY3 isoform X5 [Musca autumnalis]|uniref:protein RUFY3 isoform X5 n=2 Tax=Musca autumnalis TaxID=221902 RepID=UPI003CEF0095
MRALIEDTKKLSVNNNNNNNNNSNSSTSSTSISGGGKTTTTATANSRINRTSGSATAKNTTSNTTKPNQTQLRQQKQQQAQKQSTTTTQSAAKTSFTNKAMQQQQKQQQSTITTTTTNNSNTKTTNCPPPAGVKLRAKQQPQKQQQQQQQNQKTDNNNSSSSSGAVVASGKVDSSSSSSPGKALSKPTHGNTTSEDISGGVQDTIYLCNFRVSVDGEWLCLKELQDIDSTPAPISASSGVISGSGVGGGGAGNRNSQYSQKNKRFSAGDRHSYAGSGSGGGPFEDNARDPAEIERSNLVNICKLVVKELLEQSVRYGRMLDSDHLPLQHFFIVIEHVLGHGLRTKKGLLGPRKELWDLLQCVETYCPEAQDITASVRDLPTVRTHIGRARAWLRIALMQKKLADYFQALIEHREDALYDYYEPHALMMSDEIVIIMGILVGLNVIDCNLCVKEEDLDSQQGVIDFSLYLRSSSRNNDSDEENQQQQQQQQTSMDANGQGNMIAVLDQKNYIEELNRHLNATVANLQAKVESLTTTNALMKEDLAIARNSLLALQAENQAMRQNSIANVGPPSLNSNQSDNSSNNSKDADKNAVETLKSELDKEKKKSSELEKELKLQIALKAESDMAMKLLEKDIHEKQDTIVSLRLQLDEIKQINLEMYRKLQECEDELTQKGEMVARLQTKASQIGNILQSLEKKYENKMDTSMVGSASGSCIEKSPTTRRQQNLQIFEALTKKHKQDIGPPMKRLHLKMDGIPPFNPNNYRKSPSATSEKFHESIPEVKTPMSAKSLKLCMDDDNVEQQVVGSEANHQQDSVNNKHLDSEMPPAASLPNNTTNGGSMSAFFASEDKATAAAAVAAPTTAVN